MGGAERKNNRSEGPTKETELDNCFEGLWLVTDRDTIKKSILGKRNSLNSLQHKFKLSIRVS